MLRVFRQIFQQSLGPEELLQRALSKSQLMQANVSRQAGQWMSGRGPRLESGGSWPFRNFRRGRCRGSESEHVQKGRINYGFLVLWGLEMGGVADFRLQAFWQQNHAHRIVTVSSRSLSRSVSDTDFFHPCPAGCSEGPGPLPKPEQPCW